METDIKTSSENKDVSIVNLSGRIDTFTSNTIDEELQSLIDIGNDKLVCNFSEVEYINSDGLKVFLDKMNYARKSGGDLKFVSINDSVKKLFSLVGLTEMCDIYNDIGEAVEAFTTFPKAATQTYEEVDAKTIVSAISTVSNAPVKMGVQLTHLTGPMKGDIQEFSEDLISIGRDPSCHIAFPVDQASVSRKHAYIVRGGNRFKLADHSTNGTLVNGKMAKDVYLEDGDVIEVYEGGPKIHFRTKIVIE